MYVISGRTRHRSVDNFATKFVCSTYCIQSVAEKADYEYSIY